jgi:hypothetical protein
MVEEINHPKHYNTGKFEVIDVLQDWFKNEPLLWNSVKYLARWNKKGRGKKAYITNLKKALWYLQRKIDELELDESEIRI